MLSNKTANNLIYDRFFLEKTFNTNTMLLFSKKEIEWLIGFLKLPVDASVVDVACGSGRHLKAFLDLGYCPYGIDASPDCIALAHQNCPDLAHQIFEADFLDFSKTTSKKFDLVFIGGASFGYDSSLEVNLTHLKELLNLVNDSGFLVIQYLNKDWAANKVKSNLTFWNEDDQFYALDKRQYKDSLLTSEKIFISKTSFIQKKYADVIHTFTKTEIMAHINRICSSLKVDFQLVEIYDSFSDKVFSSLDSATPVLILKKC